MFSHTLLVSQEEGLLVSLSTMDGRDKIEVLTVESFDGKFSLAILGHTEVHFALFFVVMSS